MADCSGRKLLEELRKERELPAGAISGFGMKADLDASRAAGFTKPLDWDRLQTTIARLAAEMQLRRTSAQ